MHLCRPLAAAEELGCKGRKASAIAAAGVYLIYLFA